MATERRNMGASVRAVEDDGVQFDIDGLNAAPIREELKYGGVRVKTTAVIDRARIPVQIDIGAQWRAFLGRERMAAVPDDFAVVVADLREFLMPITPKGVVQ